MKFLVTRKLYGEIMGGPSSAEADDRPVTDVSWFDAVRFCNALSVEEGLRPCYRIEEEVVGWDRAAEIAAMREIKKVFDPQGILNPGKLFAE